MDKDSLLLTQQTLNDGRNMTAQAKHLGPRLAVRVNIKKRYKGTSGERQRIFNSREPPRVLVNRGRPVTHSTRGGGGYCNVISLHAVYTKKTKQLRMVTNS